MPARWLFKTEPSSFSYDDLVARGASVWDGVANPTALIHLRRVAKGDRVLIYHTGGERAIVGEARVAAGAYADPRLEDARRVVVDLEPVKRWKMPVTLDRIKSDPRFATFDLVRLGRLSVLPVTAEQWQALAAMSAVRRG